MSTASGRFVWIIDSALRSMGGRIASGLFGNGASVLSDGSRRWRWSPGSATGGGTAFAGDAIVMCCEHLEMENRSRPRFLYILSDGGWFDTEAGLRKIEWLGGLGVPTIHIAIGCEPLSVQADRISVISDPPTRWTSSPMTPCSRCAAASPQRSSPRRPRPLARAPAPSGARRTTRP